jgi:hypothetical protein
MSNFDSQLSLYIPRITPDWANEDAIIKKFHDQNIGHVERVDLIYKIAENGKEYFQAFIHFKHWYETSVTYNIQDRINDPERQARLVYDDPWYWMLLRNTKPRTEAERHLEARILALEQALADSTANTLDKVVKHIESTEINIDSLKCRLYDLELEHQAILHSDFVREGESQDDETVINPEWDELSTGALTNPITSYDKPSYSPICFNTVDDDREIEAWEDKHRITPEYLNQHSSGLSIGTKHGGRDDWCDL